jgi:hypothetical protein
MVVATLLKSPPIYESLENRTLAKAVPGKATIRAKVLGGTTG